MRPTELEISEADAGQLNDWLGAEIDSGEADEDTVALICDALMGMGGRFNPTGLTLPEGNVIVMMADTWRCDIKSNASAAKLASRGFGWPLRSKRDVMMALGFGEPLLPVTEPPGAEAGQAEGSPIEGLPFNPSITTVEMMELLAEDVDNVDILDRLIALEEGDKNRTGALLALKDQRDFVASLAEGAEDEG